MKPTPLFLAPILFALCAEPSIARAQGADANRVAARAIAIDANASLVKKDYAAAAERFARAEALVHAPTLLLGLARAHVGLGKLVDAHKLYTRIVREGVSRGSPAVFARAVEEAKTELAALELRMPPSIAEKKGASEPRTELDLTPAPSAAPVLAPSAAPVLAPRAPAAVKLISPLPVPDSSLRRTLGFLALGVGSAGLVAGVVTGILTLELESELSAACPNNQCRPSAQSTINTYSNLRHAAASTLLAGAALAATGTLLILTTPRPRSRGSFVRPVIGAGYFILEGAF